MTFKDSDVIDMIENYVNKCALRKEMSTYPLNKHSNLSLGHVHINVIKKIEMGMETADKSRWISKDHFVPGLFS